MDRRRVRGYVLRVCKLRLARVRKRPFLLTRLSLLQYDGTHPSFRHKTRVSGGEIPYLFHAPVVVAFLSNVVPCFGACRRTQLLQNLLHPRGSTSPPLLSRMRLG